MKTMCLVPFFNTMGFWQLIRNKNHNDCFNFYFNEPISPDGKMAGKMCKF